MKVHVRNYKLYQWRYIIGYLTLAFIVGGSLFLALFHAPHALRHAEQASALTSGALSIHSIDPLAIINLPYHLLQRLSFTLFGVTTISIKLPSILLSLLTIYGVILLIKLWFRHNIALLVAAIVATTTQFLLLSQDGTPAIIFSTVTVWLLVASTYMTRTKVFGTFWKVLACVLTAAALYIPLGVYVVLALIITTSFHPHIRYMIRKIARVRLIIAIILGVVALSPLIQAAIINPSIISTLFGFPHELAFRDNITVVGQNLFGFFLSSNSYLLRPLYSLGAIVLICVGAYKYLTVKYTARSYTVFLLCLFVVPVVIINPSHITNLYPLAILFIAMGVATLIGNWYKLFPKNPYARIAGLFPISVIVLGMIVIGTGRYSNNYTYNSDVLSHYSSDLSLLDSTLAKQHATSDSPVIVYSSTDEAPFYHLVARYDTRFTVTELLSKPHGVVIETRAAHHAELRSHAVSQIITNNRADAANRFYIYKFPQ